MNKRLREEFAKLQVEINEEKIRIVDLDRAESFGLLRPFPCIPLVLSIYLVHRPGIGFTLRRSKEMTCYNFAFPCLVRTNESSP